MKKVTVIKTLIIGVMIALDIILQIMTNYCASPRCIVDNCDRVRAKNEFYCKKHIHYEDDITITVRVVKKSVN